MPAHGTRRRGRPGHDRLRRRHPDRDAHPDRRPGLLDHLHGHGQRRPDAAGNVMAPVTWSLHHRRRAAATAGPGTGRADRASSPAAANPYSHLPGRDPADRGPERVRHHRRRHARRPPRWPPTTSSSWERSRSPPPRPTDLTTWVTGGGNLIAISPARTLSGLLGLTAAAGTTGRRLPEGRHRPPRRARASSPTRSSTTAPPTATPCTAGRPRRSPRSTPTRRPPPTFPAVTLRSVGSHRRAGRSVHLRPGPVHRPDPPGQPGLGRAGTRRADTDPLRRPVLRRHARPTGST